MLNDCIYCGDRLTTELRSLSCDNCGEGFHVPCAQDAGEFTVETESHLLRSDTYAVDCPNCGNTWSVGFDPRS